MIDCDSLRKGLDLLDSLSDAVHLSPSLSLAELGFPEHAADIGDRYRQANNFLSSIRQEKVWKGFKLCEAEFSYQQALPHHEPCFRPMFLLCALEIHILRWSLCPSDSLFAQVVQGAQEAQEAAQEVQRALKRLSGSEREAFAKEYGLLEVESALVVAETTLVKAMIEFRRKNFMSAAHAMLRGYREHERVSATIQQQQSRVDRKFRQEYILSLCRHKQETESAADESLLRSLQSLIDEKTREIRGMAFDRNGEMPESVLAATRELLQAKELYKDLTGRWRSSDGHAETLVCSLAVSETNNDNNTNESIDKNESNNDEDSSEREHESPKRSPESVRSTPATTISTSSSALSSSSACFHSQNSSSPFSRSIPDGGDDENDQEDEEEEEAGESDANDENVVNGARKTLFASPQKQKRVIFDRRTVDGLEHTYKHSLANNYGSASPQKSNAREKQIGVRGSPVRRTGALSLSVRTHIAMPRLGDIVRLLDLGADSVTDPRRRSEKARAHNSTSGGTNARAQSLREKKSDRSHSFSSPASPSRSFSQRVRTKPLVLQPKTPMKDIETQRATKDRAGEGEREGESDLLEAMDFETLFASHPADIFYKHVLLCKSRLSFATAALHVGLAIIPEQVQWMLTIIGITARPAKALCALYSLHSCEDCPYTHLATLLLVNLDKSFLQGVLECDKESSLLLKTFKILKVEQFHALIEAQSLLKSWTAKNPLWLISSARASAENHGNSSNLLSRVDFYRRALSAEKDVFPSSPVSDAPHWNKFYDIHATMAKHFVSLGHWTKALSASRQLPLPSFRCDLTLHGYALLRASSAALIVQEDFNHQTKYLQLKFSEKFVSNNGGANNPLSAQGSDVAPSPSSSSLSNKSDVSAMVIAMNREYGLDALLSLVSHQHISVRESSLYSRLLSFDHSLAALRRDSQHHAGESDVVAREFLSSWCWLLPLELTYIAFRADNHMQEAAHSQMLQLCDKGALLFSEKYLHSNSTRGEEAQRHFCQLKDLVSALIIDELAMRDSLLLKKAVAPRCKLSLSYEQTLFSRAPSLRIIAEDPQGEHDPAILLNSLLTNGRQDISKGFQSVLQGLLPGAGEGLFSQSAGSEQSQTKEQKAMKLLKKIVEKQTKTSSAISENFHVLISQQITDFQTVLNDQSSDDLVGEIVLLWLLVRGLILVEMNRVWEAVVMFKLIESLKDIAPRSKFAIFIAYFELAHLVATFDLCDNPLVIGTEYLKRSAISMQRALDKNFSPYISEYSELIQDLAVTLQQS